MAKSMADIWLERGLDALIKQDFETAETRLMISLHLHPTDRTQSLLTRVRSRMQTENNSRTVSKLDVLDLEECMLIAKMSLANKDLKRAKQFLKLANRSHPNRCADRMLRKIEKFQQQKEIACNLNRRAVFEFDQGNYIMAEKLLIQAQKKFPSSDSETLLDRVRIVIAEQRHNNDANSRDSRPFCTRLRQFVLSVITCNCFKGYEVLDDSHSDNQGNRNDENFNNQHRSTPYAFNASNIPNPRHRVHVNNPNNSGNNARDGNNERNSDNNRSRNANDDGRNPRKMFNSETGMSFTKQQVQTITRVIIQSNNDYDRLGLCKGATEREINKAYKKLAALLHPDKNKAPRAVEAFLIIGEAKERLLKKCQK